MNRKIRKKEDLINCSSSTLCLLRDEDLVFHIRNGNPEAYQVLVDRYELLVKSVVAKCLGNDPMTIEDACQETFLKALARIRDLRKPSRFRSWLCAIAQNQALDLLRRRKRIVSWNSTGSTTGSNGDDVQPVWQIPDTKANPAEKHARVEVAGIICEILDDIPNLYREPITLRFMQDMEYQEIAILLGKPLGTIKSLIHRGKMLIRDELTRRAGGLEGAHMLAS